MKWHDDPDGSNDAEEERRVALLTYRYLRMILVLPATFLLLATIFEAWSRDWQFRDSISDSYQGPVRDVFVGALMASGVCMIAYKGRSFVAYWLVDTRRDWKYPL